MQDPESDFDTFETSRITIMNRQLKFRFWDTEYKHWRELPDLYGDYQVSAFRTYGDGFEMLHFLSGEAQIKHSNGEIIIQQFTGLKDKNGREIYEGDIVKAGAVKGSINFTDSAFFIDDQTLLFEAFLLLAGDISVIGNIFENPELLS